MEKRWILNQGTLPSANEGHLQGKGNYPDHNYPNHNYPDDSALAPSIVPGLPSRSSIAPLQEELSALRQEKLDIHAQLFEAAQIQRKLSGARALRHGCLHLASEVFAAAFLPGDFTIFSQYGSKLFAAHGDIAGKGIAAGMWFTNLAGLLQSYGRPDSCPAQIASEVNRHLCYLRPIAPFVTAFVLETGGPLLGAIEHAEFDSGRLTLEPGDTLVAYSDGVLECRDPSGEEFGLDRLLASLRRAAQPSAHATLMSLLAEVQDFANGSPLRDDVSLTVIQRDGTGTDNHESASHELAGMAGMQAG
jgi:serine phosphatase RsbU (regulator of sigma subunit)